MYELLNQYASELKLSAEKFNFANPQMDPKELAVALSEVMIEKKAIGLAAPQIGIGLAAFVVGDHTNKDSCMAFFNPKVVDTFGELVYYEEGCLTFPGLFIKIKRPASIKVRFTDQYGETTTVKYSGVTARSILHEIDHLNGILFTNRANLVHLVKAKKDQKLSLRKMKRRS